MSSTQVHAGIGVCQTDILTIVCKAVAAICILSDSPDFCIAIAGNNAVGNSNINTLVVEGGFGDLVSRQGLVVGRSEDNDLIASVHRNSTGRLGGYGNLRFSGNRNLRLGSCGNLRHGSHRNLGLSGYGNLRLSGFGDICLVFQYALADHIQAQLELIVSCSILGIVRAPVALFSIPLDVVATDNIADVIQAIAQGDNIPVIMSSAQVHAGIGVCQTDVLPTVCKAVAAVCILGDSPDLSIAVAGNNAGGNGNINALVVEGGLSHLVSRQCLVVGRSEDYDLVAGFQGNIGGLGSYRGLNGLGSHRNLRLGGFGHNCLVFQQTLADHVQAHLELIVSCGILGIIGTPVILLGVPLDVVATDNVADVVQAIAQGDNIPVIVGCAQVHAGIRVFQTNVLAAVCEAIASVCVLGGGPDFCIAVARNNAGGNGNINTLVVEGSLGYLVGRQCLIVGRSKDNDLVAGFQRNVSRLGGHNGLSFGGFSSGRHSHGRLCLGGKLLHDHTQVAGEGAGCVAQLRAAKGFIGLVGTNVAILAFHRSDKGVVLGVVGVDNGGLRDQTDILIAGIAEIQVNIGLGVALHEVQVVAVLGCFQVHVNTGIHVLSGGQVILCVGSFAGDEQSLGNVCLHGVQLVGSSHNGGLNHLDDLQHTFRIGGGRYGGGRHGGLRLGQLYSLVVQQTLAYDVQAQLELIVGCSAVGVVGAPVVLGSIPLHVVATGNVTDQVQTVTQGEHDPVIVLSAKVHAGEFVLQTDVLAAVCKGVCTVGIQGNSPDFLIGVAADNAVLNGDVNALVVEGVLVYLISRQSLVVSGSEDNDLIAALQGDINRSDGRGRHGGLVAASAGILPGFQLTASFKLDLSIAGGVLEVGDVTGNGDSITLADLLSAAALHAEALDGHILSASHNDGNGYVAITCIVSGVNLGDNAGQSCLVGQLCAGLQSIGILDDLHGIRGSLHRVLLVGNQGGIVELDGAVASIANVVLNVALNGDDIADIQVLNAGALHAVCKDGLVLTAFDDHLDSDVAVVGIVSSLNLGDLTGQGSLVLQRLVGAQCVSLVNDLLGIGGSLRSSIVLPGQQLAASSKLDGAVALVANEVGDVALDGDNVIDADLVYAIALQTIGDDGLILAAFHYDLNADVAVELVIGGLDSSDSTGQGSLVGQSLVCTQCISLVHDLLHIVGSFHALAGGNCNQHAAGVELDGAVVVLQSTGNGDDVADSQLFSALALQAVALDGHILSALDLDDDGDVLVLVAPGGLDLSDLASQSRLIGQALAGGQSISGLHDGDHVHSLGQSVLPGVGHAVAFCVGDGSSQHIGGILFTVLVDVDGDSAVIVDNDLDQILADIYGPDHGVGHAANADDTEALVVYGRIAAVILIEGLQVVDSSGDTLDIRLGYGGIGLGGVYNCGLTAGEQANCQCQQK